MSAVGGVDGGLRDYPLFNIKVRLQHIGTVVLKAALVEGEARHAVTNLFVCCSDISSLCYDWLFMYECYSAPCL